MAFRFQKRVKILPGVRLNFSKRGISTTFGVRGASISKGRRGTYANIGLPGTGISYRRKISNQKKETSTAYFLWFCGLFGMLGWHHFYLGRTGKGIAWMLTGGILGIGALIDFFTLRSAVNNYNAK